MEGKTLYIIYKYYEGGEYVTDIKEANIVAETEKQIKIENKYIYRSTIRKAELDCIVSNGRYLFTYDLERGTKIWNNYYEAEAEAYRCRMEEALNTII